MDDVQAFDIETRVEAPLHGTEAQVLRGMLDYQRDTMRWKCAGLTQEQLAVTLPPSNLTLGGLMKHLTLVESQWFDHWFRDAGFAPPFDAMDWSSDWEIESARDDSPLELRELFDAAVARSDSVVDGALERGGLDAESALGHPQTRERWTLRWILAHMIEEYARHLGHADLIRQSIDGHTG